MGYHEAAEDGVRRSRNDLGDCWYYPKCCICGEEVPTWNYKRSIKYTCKNCKEKMKFVESQKRVDNNENSKNRKLKNAVDRIYKKTKKPRSYQQAIEAIEKNLHRDGWFQSTEEIMVAIELVKRGIKARHQVKFGRYCADFVLPDEKIVLEVDGILYHPKSNIYKEDTRDNLIVLSLGPEWEVIRITDELINENITKLVPAIRKIRDKRKAERLKNSGALPKWYTDRNS